MSVSGVTNSTFNGELTDDDFDPMFELVSVMADLSEEFIDWYAEAAENLETGSNWLTWFAEETDDRDVEGERSETVDFTEWMDSIGFNYTKYFKTSTTDDGELYVTDIRSDYKNSEVNELLALEVEAVSNDAEQAKAITTGMIDNFNNGSKELINMIDTLRSAGRGHVRT